MDEKEQNIAAFMHLYKPVESQISAYCRVITGSEEAAGDLLQDTLLAAFEGFKDLHKTESFIYYLCSIAKHTFLKQKRRWKFFGDSTDIEKKNTSISADSIELQPDIQLLYKAIAKLNNDQREVLLMFHIMGFSIIEIQKQLKLTEAAVKNRLQRARSRLKLLLSDKISDIATAFPANLSNTELI